jgi:hypothetical protein
MVRPHILGHSVTDTVNSISIEAIGISILQPQIQILDGSKDLPYISRAIGCLYVL